MTFFIIEDNNSIMKEDIIFDTLRTRIQSFLKDGLSQSKISRDANIKQPVLSTFISGKAGVSAETLIRLLDYVGADVVFDDEASSADYDFVEKVAAKAGAGSSLETSGETVGTYAFRKEFMARIGIHPRQCIMLDVIGDSMEPMLHEGDTILVDKSQTEIQDGKTYLVAYGEDLHVKHLFKSPNGIILHSENPRYPDVTVSNADIGSLCMVHGRVRWFGRII